MSDWTKWNTYRKARNISDCSYDQIKAKQVEKVIPSFLEESKYLIEQLEKQVTKL